jgi:hypothetical protein
MSRDRHDFQKYDRIRSKLQPGRIGHIFSTTHDCMDFPLEPGDDRLTVFWYDSHEFVTTSIDRIEKIHTSQSLL